MSKLQLLFCILIIGFAGRSAHADAPRLLSAGPMQNARVTRLDHTPRIDERGHIVAAALAGGRQPRIDVYEAPNQDAPFAPIGAIAGPEFADGICCGTLFELPQRVGALHEGTLLWAGSFGQNVKIGRRMTIRIFCSQDGGRRWTFLSEVKSPNTGGIWEPEFTVTRDGSLAMFYSDETDRARYSQTIKKIRSDDGVAWRDEGYVVASAVRSDRPGMPVTHRLASGAWMMTYELGGSAHFAVYDRLSRDGWNWGPAADLGAAIRLPNGAFPAHTPRFTVSPDGAILLAAQLIETPQLTLGARNGRVLLLNRTGDPAAPWHAIPAPVPVPGACSETCPKYQWCPNYSPALLFSEDGKQALEFASDWDGRECMTQYAWGQVFRRERAGITLP